MHMSHQAGVISGRCHTIGGPRSTSRSIYFYSWMQRIPATAGRLQDRCGHGARRQDGGCCNQQRRGRVSTRRLARLRGGGHRVFASISTIPRRFGLVGTSLMISLRIVGMGEGSGERQLGVPCHWSSHLETTHLCSLVTATAR